MNAVANTAIKPAQPPRLPMPSLERVRFLTNPWSWMALAFVMGGVAFRPYYCLTASFIGIVAVLATLALRLRFKEPASLASLPQTLRSAILAGLAFLFAAMAIGISALLVVAYMRPYMVPWRWGPILVCWIVVAPMSELAMSKCFRRFRRGEALGEREEAALMLLLSGLVCWLLNLAMFNRDAPLEYDTMRLVLSVLTVLAVAAAPLVLLESSTRRKIISLLILMHFGGIATAAMYVPAYHSPIPPGQLWQHFYRPYLQFLCMTNAYHFYAPDPGPTSYVWFRVMMEDGPEPSEPDAEHPPKLIGEWYKVPNLDEKTGRHEYPMGVDLQRFVCLTEHTIEQDTMAPPLFNIEGKWKDGPSDIYLQRVQHTPEGAGISDKDLVTAATDIVPWHTEVPFLSQRFVPSQTVTSVLIPSYVRHVAELERWANKRIKSIKVYRVIHEILPPELYRTGNVDAGDPITYRAIYFGDYTTEGKLIKKDDKDDPLLYWLLPTVRPTPLPNTRIFCYARRHAGDPNWMRDEQGNWVPPPIEEPKQQ